MAKGTNPLTGIPGNVALEKEIETRLKRGTPFCMLYADPDNFKVYNDVYGFKDGDLVILLLGRIMTWAIARHGHSGDFLAHIGGNDFVAVVNPEKAERICLAVTRCFKRLILNCYHEQDRGRGWIMGKGRDGKEQQFLLSPSPSASRTAWRRAACRLSGKRRPRSRATPRPCPATCMSATDAARPDAGSRPDAGRL